MKKFLLTTTMLVGFVAIAQAQQGRVGINTTTPAATLDVVGTPADATKPDALLVPRITRGQLQAKDAVYTVAQNGALAFVSSIADGAASGKAINVTAVGFYYYDGTTTNTWIAFGGGTAVAAPISVRTSTTGNDFTNADLNGYVFLTGTTADFSAFPATAANKGKTVTLVRTGSNNITVNGVTATSVNSITVIGRGLAFVSDGSGWQTFSAQ
jgi:hypothetical protein